MYLLDRLDGIPFQPFFYVILFFQGEGRRPAFIVENSRNAVQRCIPQHARPACTATVSEWPTRRRYPKESLKA